jgi:hypothetical protein
MPHALSEQVHVPINEVREDHAASVQPASWTRHLPSASTVATLARVGAHVTDLAAAGTSIDHSMRTGGGQQGRALAAGTLWAASGGASVTSTLAGMRAEPTEQVPANESWGSWGARMAGRTATGLGLVSELLNTGAGIASDVAATGNQQAAQASNTLWAASGVAGIASGLTSFGLATKDAYYGKAGARWGMAAATFQVASGAANVVAGAFDFRGVEHQDQDNSQNNLASSTAWMAGAALGSVSTALALKGRSAARQATAQEAQRASHSLPV